MLSRPERCIATSPNQAWSLYFVADQLQDGARFRALAIVDVYTRERKRSLKPWNARGILREGTNPGTKANRRLKAWCPQPP